jgi:S1-C subfamily serine protease
VGLGVGVLARHYTGPTRAMPRWDRVAGAGVGIVGVLALVWMTIPSLATAKGWPARMARDSAIVELVERIGPEQPAQFAAWGRAISDAPYPSAIGRLDDPPDPGVPPDAAIPPNVDAIVRRSIVKVTGRACRQIQEGSGWVVEPGLVVTNAHVVAGQDETSVEDEGGDEHSASVVAFDPLRDLAVLRAPSLAAESLPRGVGEVGDLGAVYGHPGGGELEASPARIGEEILAVGTDIYRTAESRRKVFVLAAALEPGDSGGALVDVTGEVIGVAFAIDPGRDGTSYALTNEEVQAVLDTVATRAVDTGRCLVE